MPVTEVLGTSSLTRVASQPFGLSGIAQKGLDRGAEFGDVCRIVDEQAVFVENDLVGDTADGAAYDGP
jgi:hypothetical protein